MKRDKNIRKILIEFNFKDLVDDEPTEESEIKEIREMLRECHIKYTKVIECLKMKANANNIKCF